MSKSCYLYPMVSDKIKELAQLLTHKDGFELFELITTRKEVPYTDLKEIVQNEVTLKRRLDELKGLGLIKRQIIDQKYKPTIYHVTQKGKDVFDYIQKIDKKLEGS